MASSSSADPRADFEQLNSALARWALRSCIRDGVRLQSAPYAICLATGACGGLVLAALADLTFDGITATIVIAAFALVLALVIQPRSFDPASIVHAISATDAGLPGDARLYPLQRNILALAESRPELPPPVDWSNLTSRMSHELRTPLNAVIGFSDMLANGAAGAFDERQWQGYARNIHQSGLDILKAAEDALTLTSLIASGGGLKHGAVTVSIAELLDDAVALVSELSAGHPAAHTNIHRQTGGVTACCSDKGALKQAIANLLMEAQSRAATGSAVVVNTIVEGSYIAITVSVSRTNVRSSVVGESLNLTLARTILALTGSQLAVSDDVSGAWRATTILDCAAQPDFF